MASEICCIVKYWFVFILVIPFGGCNFESEHNLGSNYYLLGDEGNTVVSKDIKDKRLFDDVILGEIVDYDFDEKFILIFRNASVKAKPFFQDHTLWNQQHGKDSIQLWIIEKTEGKIYGPLDLAEYLDKRKLLKIPETLKVKVKL